MNAILGEIQNRKNVDYKNKASVRDYNAAYDRCAQLVRYIDNYYPERIEALLRLLEHPDCDVVGHCAPMVLRLQHATELQKMQAINAIYKLLDNPEVDNVTKLGFSMSLEKWEKELCRKESTD